MYVDDESLQNYTYIKEGLIHMENEILEIRNGKKVKDSVIIY